MENPASSDRFYWHLGKISIWLAFGGLVFYLMLFPSGVYYGFFCGVMAVAAAVLAKRGVRSVGTTIALIVGVIDVGLSIMAFYGIYILYVSVSDPVYGAHVTEVLADMLSQYGISIETFALLMSQ